VHRGDSIVALERIRLPGMRTHVAIGYGTDVVDAMPTMLRRPLREIPASASIAFAFPGPISGGRLPQQLPRCLVAIPYAPDVRALLADRTRREVVIINDVSAAAWYFAERIAADRFVVVTSAAESAAKIFDRRHPLGVPRRPSICRGDRPSHRRRPARRTDV